MSLRQRTWAVLAGGFLLLAALGGVASLRSCQRPSRSPDALRTIVRKHQGVVEPASPPPSSREPEAASCLLTGETIDDLSGTRIAGIVVQAHSTRNGAFVADAVSDASGTYALALPEGPYSIHWFKVHEDETTVARLGASDVDVSETRVRQDLHFHLYPFVVVEGVVLGSGNAPLANAKVMAHFAGPWKPEWNDRTAFAPVKEALQLTALSREDGTFTLGGMLVPAKYWMHAAHPSCAPFNGEAAGAGFTVVAGHGQRHRYTIHMRPEDVVLLKGRLIAREGTPVPRATVAIRVGSIQHEAESDAEGRFSRAISPAPVTVIARHPDYRRALRELGVIPGKADPSAAPDDVVLVMERKPLRVTVIAVDGEGRPVDTPLIISEMDPSTSDLNPNFKVALLGGKGQFHADTNIKLLVALPPDSPFTLASVSLAGDPMSPGSLLSFEGQETEVRLVLKRR
jgi:hypothetical protein